MIDVNYSIKLHLASKSLRTNMSINGFDQIIFSLFDTRGRFIMFNDVNCFKDDYIIYKSTAKSLYILLESLINLNVDFLIIKILLYKDINGISSFDMAKYLNMSLEKYNIKVHDCDLSAMEKFYGVVIENIEKKDEIKLPTKIKCDVIRETLIHFNYIDENSKLIGEPEEFAPNRCVCYVKAHATYKEIKEYVFNKYGMRAHSAYIAEVKRNHGIKMINVSLTEETRIRADHPTEKMTKVIEEALIHFGVIKNI